MKLSRSIRGGAAATFAVLLAASALTNLTPAQALDPTGVGPSDPTRAGFPAYYTDDAGVALQLCVDGSARCGLSTLRSDGAGGPGVGVPPDGEGFYWMATTSLAAPGLEIDIEFAAEAAWLNRRTAITFDRVRIRGHSDTAGDIVVDTPYGAFTVTAGDPVEQRNVNFTEDVGCVRAPCNFGAMTTSPRAHITDWITSTTAPAGYLGNSVTSTQATVGGAPAIVSAGGASTSRWVVMGKKANPNRVLLPAALNFGLATRVTNKSVTMRNMGTAPRTISSVKRTGSKAFTVLASSTCKSGRVLAVGARCSVDVKYKPGPLKVATGTLTITDNVGAHDVRLKARSR